MAQRQPASIAIFAPTGRRQDGRATYRHCTYQQLDADSDRIARGLIQLGLGRGIRIALMVTPGLDFFSLTFALFKAGAVPVLIDPGIGLAPLKTCLAEAEPEAFIGIARAHAARILFGWARGSIRQVITVGRRLLWGGLTLDQVRKLGGEGPPVLADTREDDVAAILFTSGSTGIPKGAVYRHGNFIAQVEMIRETYGIEPGEVDLPTFPPFSLFDPALGMTTVVPDMDASRPASVDPTMLVETIDRFGVTNMFGSPAVLDKLGRYTAERGIRLPSLRRVLSAGAPVAPAILDRFTQALSPGVQVFTPYGATESLPVASIGSDEILRETRTGTDRGEGICVGRPVGGVSVSIIEITDAPVPAWDQARELPAGEIGEIVVRSPTVTREYFHREAATGLAKIRMPDGSMAHRMGDLGYFDARGRLWFCGRKSHRVVTPEGTLFTEQVEGMFNAESGLRSALVGVDRDGVTTPFICLEVESGRAPDPEALLASVASKHPMTRPVREVLIHRGRFPVDIRHNSKIFREKLAVWAAKELQ